MDDSLFSVDQDYTAGASPPFAATSGRVGAAAAAGQAGRIGLGYDPNALLAPFRLDAGGNVRVAPASPAGSPIYVYNGQTPPAASSQYGGQIMALQTLPTPVYLPLSLDPLGALNVHEKSKVTWRLIAPSVKGGTAVSLFSLFNGTAASVVRVHQVNVQTPYLYQTGNTILGLSGNYNQSVAMLCEMRRIAGQTKVAATTTPSAASADSADTLDPGIVPMSLATISGAAAAPFHRADANSPSGLPWYLRGDAGQKTLLLRPGEGMSVTTVSSTSTVTFDIEVVVTVAPA